MIGYALAFGFGALGLALAMNLWRLFKGPGVADRIFALDTMVINVIGLIVLAGIAGNSGTAFEAALLLAAAGAAAHGVAVELPALPAVGEFVVMFHPAQQEAGFVRGQRVVDHRGQLFAVEIPGPGGVLRIDVVHSGHDDSMSEGACVEVRVKRVG